MTTLDDFVCLSEPAKAVTTSEERTVFSLLVATALAGFLFPQESNSPGVIEKLLNKNSDVVVNPLPSDF